MWNYRSTRLACLPVLLFALASAASATTLGIDVVEVGQAPIHLTPTLVEISPGVFTSADSFTVAGSFDLAWDLLLEADPKIMGSFTLQNLSGSTQTFSVSATLGVLPVPGPTLMGGSVGPITYTDLGDDGITFSASPFYQAQIDGSGVQNLGAFALGPTSGVVPIQSFGVPIPSAPGPGVLTSIGVAFPGFSLTAGDKVSAAFDLEVVPGVPVPEPAAGPLVAFGLAGLVSAKWRRRR